ncbi:glutamyl-tRNA reductase [uncultured Ornithinimicrobium sp.]|uniref:glutamyl-tRNA reductase n=1 Tax=uncultured Ornithinimicrobium sp. TaxID=259307 RepID=UPI0025976566|nr:glutamyl-tRNA reductase [uncultured Ornithinimicrobium sp.]
MSVLVVGLSHRTAPMDLLERAALGPEGARDLASRVGAGEHVEEALVLATCNRLEVVVEAGTFHGALTEVGERMCELTGIPREQLNPHLYVHYDERAVSHLFGVACGLDSMAVGESQILGQLRDALASAQQDGRVGPVLNPLLQQALRVGKRAHAETTIDEVSRSLVSTGLDLAATVLPDLAGARTVVVGAGAMSGLAVATLARAGVRDLTVVNRTAARADRLAGEHGAGTGDWVDVLDLAAGADLVVTCTGAVGHVLEADALQEARAGAGRVDSPAVLLDLALPRDVDPAVTGIDGVRLWALADLQREMTSGAGDGAASGSGDRVAVEAVRDLVTAEVATYLTERRAARLGPTLAALRAQAARVVDQEMVRLDQRVPHLAQDERAEVRRTVQRVVDKLLHTPSVRVKELQHGGEPADYGQALRELFDLDPAEPAVVRTAPPEVTAAPISEASLPSSPADRGARP